MAVLSLLRGFGQSALPSTLTKPTTAFSVARQFTTSALRKSGDHDRRFAIVPSKWAWTKYKDMLHFYVWLGLIPACTVAFLANVFIGPATLTEIPPGYTPKPWEYHRHPISRFILKYGWYSHQEIYERNLHYMFSEEEKRQMRLMGWKVERLMRERGDYPNYFVKNSILSKYLRGILEEEEIIRDEAGYDDPYGPPSR